MSFTGSHDLPDAPEALVPALQQAVHDTIISSGRQLTASDLERQIAHQEGCPRRWVRAVVRHMIGKGTLEYSYTFGQSYLVQSFRNPVDISARFTIVPPEHQGSIADHRLALTISPGISFGCGRHSTTRMALEALEEGWAYQARCHSNSPASILDIGTGSGILAIAAACLGADAVLALDTDACARSEARANVCMNPGATNVTVADTPLDSVPGPFDIILANLRLPTLVQLAEPIKSRLSPMGSVVLSGFREGERMRLRAVYAELGFQRLWGKTEAGWAADLMALTE